MRRCVSAKRARLLRRRPSPPRPPRPLQFIIFDYQDAIAQTLVFLTSISGGVALVAGLPKALGNARLSAVTFVEKVWAGDLVGACSAAGDIQGAAMKGHGAGAGAGHATASKAAHQSVK